MLSSEPRDITVHLFFAFDVGYEIDLNRSAALLESGEPGPLAHRPRTPESIQYRPPPLRMAISTPSLGLPATKGVAAAGPMRAELALFDFGALSLVISAPIRATTEALLELAGELGNLAQQTAEARLILAHWLERLRPAVIELESSTLSEEFVVFEMGEVHDGWLEQQVDRVAALVRLDPGPLSQEEVHEATRLHLSYAPNDLVVIDWAAALVADRHSSDTLQIIEYANVQLLEFRHIDDRLDDRLEAAYRLLRPGPSRRKRSRRANAEVVRRVRELEIEATSLFERAENALKLIGDQYLARVFGLASARFHLGEWQASIRRKLETVGDVYDLLVEQSSSRRMEVLEVTVVVLIALEIVLALIRH